MLLELWIVLPIGIVLNGVAVAFVRVLWREIGTWQGRVERMEAGR